MMNELVPISHESLHQPKGISSRILLSEFPHLRRQFWGRHLWARGIWR
jgi:REP element-mobilizing transposase RayT